MSFRVPAAVLALACVAMARNLNTTKTSIDRFPPILEYVIQRIQGFYSVHVHNDHSLYIYQTTEFTGPIIEIDNVTDSSHIKVSTSTESTPSYLAEEGFEDIDSSTDGANRINRTSDINMLEEFVLQHHTIEEGTKKPLHEVVVRVTTKDGLPVEPQ